MSNYTLGIKELDNLIGGIKKGSNLMLIGPPMSGKELILYNIMYHGASKNENAVILVNNREPAKYVLEWFEENKLELPLSRIGIVDCVTRTHNGGQVESETIKIASGPIDLSCIGVKISQFFDNFFMKKNIREIQLHINSLSTMLMYSNIQTVFRFTHVFAGRIKAAGALGIYMVESGMTDEQTIAAFKQLFNGMIEIKSENDKNFIRVVVEFQSKPTPWFEYEIEKGSVRIVG
ncbi:KaiC [uncultured archaeon]|nr:KaiC [uncultured archaeon]